MERVVIVGAGNVGSCVAQTVALRGLADEAVLVDKRPARARAEAADLMCALPRLGSRCVVRAGAYEDCADAGTVVVCAAAPARLGQTRNDMFLKNAAIVRDVAAAAEGAGFAGLYLVVSNPVDLLARLLTAELGIASERVAGTGTLLDTLRLEDCLRARPGAQGGAEARALALGEHGEGLVVAWERTTVGGEPVPEADREPSRRAAIEAAYDIMKGKGSTSHGIALAVSEALSARRARDGRVLPLSVAADGAYGIEGMTLSLPVSFDDGGWPRVAPVELAPETAGALRAVAERMRAVEAELSDRG